MIGKIRNSAEAENLCRMGNLVKVGERHIADFTELEECYIADGYETFSIVDGDSVSIYIGI